MPRVRTDDFYSDDNAISRGGWLSMYDHGEGENRYSLGSFFHPQGIVDVYRQEDHTRLLFAHGGRLFHRSWSGSFGNRTINQLARQFVADIMETIL